VRSSTIEYGPADDMFPESMLNSRVAILTDMILQHRMIGVPMGRTIIYKPIPGTTTRLLEATLDTT